MSLCLFKLDALGLGGSRVGRLGRLRSPHALQSSNLSRFCRTRNPTVSTLDPTYLENIQSYEIFDKSGFGEVMTLVNVNPTILEECRLRIHVDCVKNMFCDSYIVEFAYDTTFNYYER